MDLNSAPDAASRRGTQRSAVSANPMETKNAMDEYKKKMKEKAEQENSALWQHPFVDVFKHFRLLPGSDWKQNKKQGGVEEYFAKEIGRRAINIEGTISANNYVQLPHPQGPVKTLGLTGRYCYLMVKCPRHGLPFSYHIDLGMAERSHGIRISISNLFKNFNTSNGFVAQVPLELKNNCWTVVVLDIIELLKKSNILPTTYLIEGSYQIRSINLCANSHVRGVFTSDNLYDFVTLPADMRFKFAFDLIKWPEYFNWQTLPQDWNTGQGGEYSADENQNLQNLIEKNNSGKKVTRADQRKLMRQEIDGLLNESMGKGMSEEDMEMGEDEMKKQKYEEMQNQLSMQFKAGPADHPVSGFVSKQEQVERKPTFQGGKQDYKSGQFVGQELSRSHKLDKDPIMELKHIIGYQAEKCLNLKWSRQEGENSVIFTSGGTMIAMDTETNEQKRFFFGHSAPICCFDLNESGTLIASAQEGKNSIIRIWDYLTARCITMVTMPVVSLKCLSFSYDGRYLASVGKDSHNKELIIIWDISKIQRGEKPEIVARQTSEFNILALKFSPIDVTKLASCGKENIRFWRVRDTGNIRGSAVVLNHHARNTVFTSLDFEYGFKSADKDENEALKRVFVGSKHGMIFQVNYQTESLEATYKTNDAAIYSISVNDAFCVTGSEDQFLRVWPLDFQEFFMEAQHEGTVCAVDISPDGLKVACGTLYGSIGILDKSNQNYKTLLRSHTDEILAMDFHRQKMNIITVSRDKTIRLWDMETFNEVYEFSSPVDQPLCISAHPQLPIFAGGFESGLMRIFDIESTGVQNEFSQFNKPLKSLSYDNYGKILVACCADGSVSIHNAARGHLPIKMLHLELAPEFVHVAFTDRVLYDNDQRFALMGEYGNNVVVYDSESFLIQHQIMVNSIVQSFKFANNNRDLLIITKDCKVKFYSLIKYEGIFLREIANIHRGSINGIDVSNNSGYLLTGGQDSMVKIWDYEAQKAIPYYFQSYIGHTYPINSIMFNPRNNSQIISIGERDGIYVWEFNGDVEQDFKQAHLAGQDFPQSLSTLDEKQPVSKLEELRTKNKAKKAFRNQLSEDTFIIPSFKPMEQSSVMNNKQDFIPSPNIVTQIRNDRKLAYTHFLGCGKTIESDFEYEQGIKSKRDILEQKLVTGYDGYGGVHDNLMWNPQAGFTYFTLNNKLVIENTKTREQSVFCNSGVQLSCMAMSVDGRYLAVGEGSQNSQGGANIYIYDIEKRQKISSLAFHQKGIQSMAFSYDNKYLISLGVQGENMLSIFEISSGVVVRNSVILGNIPQNQIKVDPFVVDSAIQFVTVGNNATLTIWRYMIEEHELATSSITAPDKLKNLNFLSIEFTHYLPAPVGTYYIMIGTDDGSIVAYDQQAEVRDYVDLGMMNQVMYNEYGAIGCISIKHNTVVIGNSNGLVVQYPIHGSDVQPADRDQLDPQNVGSAVIALHMDEMNNEGLIGTEAGGIYYVNFMECITIQLVQSNNKHQDAVRFVQYDPKHEKVFLASCGEKSDELKVYTTENCDAVNTFNSNIDEDGYVVFVISTSVSQGSSNKGKQKRLVGFSNGIIKRISLDTLAIEHVFKVNLNPGEKITCGHYSDNGINFVFGTNQGALYIASLRTIGKSRVEISYCRIDNINKSNQMIDAYKSQSLAKLNNDIMNDNESIDIDKNSDEAYLDQFIGITSIHFPYVDPIGTILVGFDDATCKLWQSSVKNEQQMKIMELEQTGKGKSKDRPVHYDISQVGYQQFDLIDSFDLFANPFGLQDSAVDRINTKKYKTTNARFAPGTSATDMYYAIVDEFDYLYIRNYKKCEILKRVSLNHCYPTCFKMIEFGNVELNDESQHLVKKGAKGTYLTAIGTKEGKVLVYKFGQISNDKMFTTKSGVAFGGISAIDITYRGTDMVTLSESGEIIQYDLLKKLNEE